MFRFNLKKNSLFSRVAYQWNTELKKSLDKSFHLREKFYFKKKKPKSEIYPFEIIDPFEIFGEDDVFGDFHLVGEEWRNKESTKDVAICWGFNDWKLGFVSEYLSDYRVAFAPRKIAGFQSLFALRRFPIKPKAFFFWGYTEPAFVKYFAEKYEVDVFRMEDGFVRSAKLGASHATPYSLVVDSAGLYYNPDQPSDLENILNYHCFSSEEIISAERCLSFFKESNVSKYNPPVVSAPSLSSIKLKKKIAILGQVDRDMSIRMGNKDKWSFIDLIRLAKKENPDADIIYRPHPDVYQGFQRSRFRKKSVENICEISSPEIPIRTFLEKVDHVYTISSLSGLEALLLGIKVTVVGAAFYAGWGLTDDRLELQRRFKKRSLVELFAAVYLQYPRYLADFNDTDNAFVTTVLRIKADQSIGAFDLACEMQKNAADPNLMDALIRSDYWPRLIFSQRGSARTSAISRSLSMLSTDAGRIFQIFYVYAICGVLENNRDIEKFLGVVRGRIDADIFNELLLKLDVLFPGEYLSHQFSWLIAEHGHAGESIKFLGSQLRRRQSKMIEKTDEDEQSDDRNVVTVEKESRLSPEKAGILFSMFEHALSLKKYDDAIEYGKELLLNNYFASKLIVKFSNIAELRFDSQSARVLAKFGQNIDLYSASSSMVLFEARNFDENLVENNPREFLELLVKMVTLKPDLITAATFFARKYKDLLGIIDMNSVLTASLRLDNEQSVRKAIAYIAIERPELAVRMLESMISQGDESDGLKVTYSQALSFAGRIEDAIVLMQGALRARKTSANYRELLRLLVITGRYDKSLKVIESAQKEKVHLGDMHLRKSFFGNRMVKEALETFKEIRLSNTVALYYPEKYLKDVQSLTDGLKVLLLAIYGPGDEIRFASIYNLIKERFAKNEITISCEPRLLNLFSRSFEGVNFVGVPRPRSADYFDLKRYVKTPGYDLIGVIDDNAHEAIVSSDKILMVTDMLSECLSGYLSFPGTPYLRPDENLIFQHRNKLSKEKKLVGLSWRSSLTTHSRNEHYLTIEELEPLFSIPGIQFVNFQYDECQDELDWVEQRFPGKLIDISEVDHYNDFDNVAALMKCMDLMIAPATTVVELAGAIGCPTWMISNSSELHWRKIDESGTDVWHHNVIHVEGAVLGNKKSLVSELAQRLSIFST